MREHEVIYRDEWGYQQSFRTSAAKRSAATFRLYRLYFEAYGKSFRDFIENVRPRARLYVSGSEGL
jgi:hypothetical protein